MDLPELCAAYLDALSAAASAGDLTAANHLDVALGSFETALGQMRIALEKRRAQPGYAAECALQRQEAPARFRRYGASDAVTAAKFDGAQRALF